MDADSTGPRAVAGIEPSRAPLWFIGTWLIGSIGGGIALAAMHSGDDDAPIGALAVSLVALWAINVAGCVLASRTDGTGSLRVDLGVAARPVDAAGFLIGAIAQVALVPVTYIPLRAIWPDTFSRERLEETARDLVDRAEGGLVVLLVVLVAIGAPLVEELVYRGLLQRPALTAFPRVPVIVLVAAVFALIHFRPVEYPGLFVAGLVFGVCAAATGRLGMAVAAHVGFNATGLALVL
ncbi:MAG: CPBP family intramembrane glutamic endopeptidase [Actinomycetota bacterium]